jgi:hypothetical protein
MFYCDPTATQWQQDQYEYFHARLRRLHEEFNIPYFYVEWRQALSAIRCVMLFNSYEFLLRIPSAVFVLYWFAGAVCVGA